MHAIKLTSSLIQSLLDDIINTVNVLADRALDSVERLLLSIPPQKLGFVAAPVNGKKQRSRNADPVTAAAPDLPPEEAAKLEIENGTHQLETLLNASIDKNFDIFELYVMQNILTVRPHDQPFMRLTHYEGLDIAATSAQPQQPDQHSDKPTPESITALRRRLQASQKLNAVLEAEKARNDALLQRLRGVLGVAQDGVAGDTVKTEGGNVSREDGSRGGPFGFLRDKGGLEESGGDQPITTTTEFTLSQLQALRSLSSSLRTLLPKLAPPTDSDAEMDVDADGGSSSASNRANRPWRRQRAEYIESSSRKFLETAAGLELGPDGEVRDGEWQGEGRGLSKGEVEGLEKVVAILGGAGGSSGGGGGEEGTGEAMDES